jgi:hypothetical protein
MAASAMKASNVFGKNIEMEPYEISLRWKLAPPPHTVMIARNKLHTVFT